MGTAHLIRRLVIVIAAFAPVGVAVPPATATPVAAPAQRTSAKVPKHLADPLGGLSPPVIVAYRDVIAAADAHLLRGAIVDLHSRWIAVVDGGGQVFAARAPALEGGADNLTAGGGARMPSAYAVTHYLQQHGVFVVRTPGHADGQPGLGLLMLLALPAVLVVVLLAARRRAGGAPGPVRPRMNTTPVQAASSAIRFADVAGCDEAVEELAEIGEFLRDPSRFAAVGARMPRGVILHGPPGTGKTLLAKALAGEATVPFFAVSAAELVEVYVGTGPARVRNLFAQARREPDGAVIFFDEIDAIGRARSGGQGGSSEHEATLNQLLVELDGFGRSERIVVLGATNRLDILDQALLRPGRFDRHVRVDLPAERGRLAILRLHAQGKPLADPDALAGLARVTGGMSGAALENILNEAAIMAARARRDVIDSADLTEGQLRALAGPRRRDAPLRPDERVAIAWHEAGHALAAELCPTHEKTQRVTILARGQTGGLALYGRGDRALHTPQMLHERMIVALAGRVAEELCTGTLSSGAANDLEVATGLARDAVTRLGFSEQARGTTAADGWVSSESRRARIDEEVDRLIADAHEAATRLLRRHTRELEALAEALLSEQQLDRAALEAILGVAASHAPDPSTTAARERPARPAEPQEAHPRRRPVIAAAAAALRAWREVRESGGRAARRPRAVLEPALSDVQAQHATPEQTLPHTG